jgi:hypothetical protein
MKTEILIWLFPIIFMIHEFEEIIFMRWWLEKYREPILNKYPNLGKRAIGQFDLISTEAFSLIVAEEFLIVSVIVVISALTTNYDLYAGLISAYSIHLLSHLIQTIVIRKYTPAIITTVLTGFFCGFVFTRLISSELLSFNRTFIYSVVLTLVVFINLKLMYYVVRKIKILIK